ncbi:hypothetical protein OROGR_031023 [Orobanche gracilis]
MNVRCIPDKYICRRWTKAASVEVGQQQTESGYSQPSGNNELLTEAFKCVGIVDGDPNRKAELLQIFRDAIAKFSVDNEPLDVSDSLQGNKAIFEQYYGLPKPQTCRLEPPEVCKTKGSAIRKKSHREKAIEKVNKQPRKCRKCNTLTYHDTRNCPGKPKIGCV